MKVMVDLCIVPLGVGVSLSGYIAACEKVLADARTGGDEPVELATKLRGKSAVIADADRVSAARQAVERLHPADPSVFWPVWPNFAVLLWYLTSNRTPTAWAA